MSAYPPQVLDTSTTIGAPSRARHFVEARSVAEVQQACSWARECGVRVLVLGGGSNVIPAPDVDALVVKSAITGIEPIGVDNDFQWIEVGGGENWHQLVLQTLQHQWFGLENLSLIPGTVGAAPIQNIGAYGVEFRHVFDSLSAVHIETGQELTFSAEACEFGYRDSVFKGRLRGQYVITRVRLRLSRHAAPNLTYPALVNELRARAIDKPTPSQVSEAVCAIRRTKLPDPAVTPNCGSFFKNPVVAEEVHQRLAARWPDLVAFPSATGTATGVKLAAAWLIEKAGWKGKCISGIRVHPEHALVLTNPDRRSADNILSAAAAIQADVHQLFGVELELEPQYLG